MKPDVLSLGRFPDATMDELSRRFTLHRFSAHFAGRPLLTLVPQQESAR